MAAVIKLKGSGQLSPIRVAGIAEKDSDAQRIVARDGSRVTGEFPLDQIDIWYNEPDGLPDAPPCKDLRDDERLQLTWSLTWPCLLVDLFYHMIRELTSTSPVSFNWIDLTIALGSFFVLSAWVVRRTVGLNYRGFHLVALRPVQPPTRTMSYAESLSVAWLLTWRTCVILLPVLLPIAIIGTMLGHVSWSLPRWFVSSLAGLVISYLWVVPSAIRKNYAGFSFGLQRSDT